MDLIINPRAEIVLSDAHDPSAPLMVRAPVRASGLRVTHVDRASDPALFRVLLLHRVTPYREIPGNLGDGERERLRDAGFLIRPEQESRPVHYTCDLEAVHPGTPGAARAMGGDLVVNPTIEHLGSDGPRRESRGRIKLSNRFSRECQWLSVDHDGAVVRSFFSWSPSSAPDLSTLEAGAPLPAGLDPAWRERLAAAGVAVPSANLSTRAARRATAAGALGDVLRARRYVVVPQGLDRWTMASIRRYYRELIDEGYLLFGDKDWPKRYFARWDPIAHFFHEQWTALASDIAGEPLRASFPFFVEYHPGSDLPAHTDREQCVVSISVQIDHTPPPSGPAPWPIYLQPGGPETNIPVHLRLGEAAMFYGQEVRHYREALPSGSSSFWFLFYVREGFEGALD